MFHAGQFQDKVVIVTGSSNGIGRYTATEFARRGAKVVLTGRNCMDLAEAEQDCLNAGAQGRNLLTKPGDISSDQYIEELVTSTIGRFGQLDVLINNAAALYVDETGKERFDQPIEVFEKNVAINLRAPFKLTLLCVPHLEKTKGCIVNVSSVMALSSNGIVSMPYYGICKAALDHMSRCMALDYIEKGIRVNTVNPGLISTQFFTKLGVAQDKVHKMEEYVASIPSCIPSGRVGQPADVANLILFLADGNLSSYIVGQTIPICGGASLCMGLDQIDYKTPMA